MEDKPKKKRGPSPVIIPRDVSEWIKKEAHETKVNTWKEGGGRSYNGRNRN